MKIILSLLIFSICFSSCTWMKEHQYEPERSQSQESIHQLNMLREPGKCYAKCLIHDEYQSDSIHVYQYIGQNPTSIKGVDYYKLTNAGSTKKWVRQKAKENCELADPDDCLVWRLIEAPVGGEGIYIVSDTLNVKEFSDTIIITRVLINPGGFTEWKEIICKKDVTSELLKNVQLELFKRGYNVDINGKINTKTKAALTSFQKDYRLPTGGLYIDTLEALGLR